jgi:hypothetical protein
MSVTIAHLPREESMKRVVLWVFMALILAVAALAGKRIVSPVTLNFPDFPKGQAAVELGQSVNIKVAAAHDGGKGVTWTCVGPACTKMITTSKWATFFAGGITGTATITATSIKRPSVSQTIKITVFLNAVPNVGCGSVGT